ncbi:MAG: hypothetical protein H6742_15235 [Alphaproteobacteria bacterium]|nr:hypothetical protein [Alphaproteobacteria bacterium]
MSSLSLPTLDLPTVASSAFGKQAQILEARCRALVREVGGRSGPASDINWRRLEKDLDDAIEQAKLAPRLAIMLPALLARLGSRAVDEPKLQATVDGACALACGATVWPTQAWAMLTWATDRPEIRQAIAQARRRWPDVLKESNDLLMSLDLKRPAGQAVSAQIVAEGRDIHELDELEHLPPHSPLSRAVWEQLLGRGNRAWLERQPEHALGAWLHEHQGRARVSQAVNTLLGPSAGKDGSKAAIAEGSPLDRRLRLCVGGFKPTGDGLDLRGVAPSVQALIRRWLALRDMDKLLAKWGANPSRQAFWRSYRDQLRDTRWFGKVGYLAMRFGDLWFIEHDSGLRDVVAVEDSFAAELFPSLREARSVKQAANGLEKACRGRGQQARTRVFHRDGEKQMRKWLRENRLE